MLSAGLSLRGPACFVHSEIRFFGSELMSFQSGLTFIHIYSTFLSNLGFFFHFDLIFFILI